MGYAICMGFCINCKNPIQFNPRRVPVLTINGSKEPLCEACARRWCEIHKKNPADYIFPDAYAPVDESEL